MSTTIMHLTEKKKQKTVSVSYQFQAFNKTYWTDRDKVVLALITNSQMAGALWTQI